MISAEADFPSIIISHLSLPLSRWTPARFLSPPPPYPTSPGGLSTLPNPYLSATASFPSFFFHPPCFVFFSLQRQSGLLVLGRSVPPLYRTKEDVFFNPPPFALGAVPTPSPPILLPLFMISDIPSHPSKPLLPGISHNWFFLFAAVPLEAATCLFAFSSCTTSLASHPSRPPLGLNLPKARSVLAAVGLALLFFGSFGDKLSPLFFGRQSSNIIEVETATFLIPPPGRAPPLSLPLSPLDKLALRGSIPPPPRFFRPPRHAFPAAPSSSSRAVK